MLTEAQCEIMLAGELLSYGPDAILEVFGGVEPADCPVTHHFGPGVYIRECFMPAGTLVVGHAHRQASLNVMLKGRMVLLIEGAVTVVEAPYMTISPPGRKAAYVLEDAVWQNIFATEEQDLDRLEGMFIERTGAIT
jgi:hypothetical protein